jgi:hypothetical protein
MPTAGCQISTLIFNFFLWRGALLISHEKYIKDGKVVNHLELRSKVLLRVQKPTQALQSVKGPGNTFD